MSKQYNIQWRRSDYSKLSWTIRQFNEKLSNVSWNRPDIAGLQPDKLDYKTVKESIKTRQDLNRFINSHKRYLREGAEEVIKSNRGAVATKWEEKEFRIMQGAENLRRTNARKKLEQQEVTVAGKSTGVKRAEMGKIKENATKHSKKKFKNMSQKEWENAFKLFDKKMRSDYREEQLNRYKDNYVKGLRNAGFSKELQELVERVPASKLIEIADTDDTATIDFIYDPVEHKLKNDTLTDLWVGVLNNL
jgi:hypothetical protein